MAGWEEAGPGKRMKNTLPLYGNKESMNLNSMILTNICGSPYFREELINYKTFHEVVDEIFYKVDHLEPWEKNSRKLAGQVGMCAGVKHITMLTPTGFVVSGKVPFIVRGVAAGGIVSTAYCLLYKLFTLKLTRKQVTVMLNHGDSPYIRGLGFMYVRYCQPPADFWDWFGPYIDDDEEIDLKAGGGYSVTIGEMVCMFMTKLDWFGTLFPRMPVNVGRNLEQKVKEAKLAARNTESAYDNGQDGPGDDDEWEAGRKFRGRSPPPRRRSRERSRSRERRRSRSPRSRNRSRSSDRRNRSRSMERRRSRSRDRDRGRDRRRSRSKDRDRRSRSRDRKSRRSRSHSRDRKSHRNRSRDRSHSRDRKSHRNRSRDRRRSRSRSRGKKDRRSRSPQDRKRHSRSRS